MTRERLRWSWEGGEGLVLWRGAARLATARRADGGEVCWEGGAQLSSGELGEVAQVVRQLALFEGEDTEFISSMQPAWVHLWTSNDGRATLRVGVGARVEVGGVGSGREVELEGACGEAALEGGGSVCRVWALAGEVEVAGRRVEVGRFAEAGSMDRVALGGLVLVGRRVALKR